MDYPKKMLDTVNQMMLNNHLEGFLPGHGSHNTKKMLVGEAPGEIEIKTKIPFSGKSGKKLDGWLADSGLKRDEFYITSAVKSRPFSIKKQRNKRTGIIETKYPNRTPTKIEVLTYAPILDYEIQIIQPKILIPMGNIGLQRLLGNRYTISTYHGKLLNLRILEYSKAKDQLVQSTNTYNIFPIYHPAAVLYKQSLETTILQDWQLLASIIAKYNLT